MNLSDLDDGGQVMMRAQNSLVPAHKCICSTLLRPQWTVRKLRPRNPDRRRRRLVLRPEPRHRFCSFSPRHISDCHTIALVHPRLSRNICHRHSREDSGVCMQLPFSRLRVVSIRASPPLEIWPRNCLVNLILGQPDMSKSLFLGYMWVSESQSHRGSAQLLTW